MDAAEFQELQGRLTRIESMLGFLLGTTEQTQTVQPTTEQAKQLHVMGLSPWPRLTRNTTKFELWKEGFEKLVAAHQAANPGEQDGKAS